MSGFLFHISYSTLQQHSNILKNIGIFYLKQQVALKMKAAESRAAILCYVLKKKTNALLFSRAFAGQTISRILCVTRPNLPRIISDSRKIRYNSGLIRASNAVIICLAPQLLAGSIAAYVPPPKFWRWITTEARS
jgi:hypothetical protein